MPRSTSAVLRHRVRARARSCAAALLAGGLVAAALSAPVTATAAAPAAAPAAVATAPAALAPSALRAAAVSARAPKRYTPPVGVRFNDPLGGRDARRKILGHLIRTVDSVPSRQAIRIASWNIRSNDLVDALVRAHRRGVSVRVVIDRLNANPDNPNEGFDRLARALAGSRNGSRPPELRSVTQRCASACRGPRGIAHAKFFLFSKAGNARWITMFGSANATDLAATHQWNDLFTLRDRPGLYEHFELVFDEMVSDQHATQGFVTADFGPYRTAFYPYRDEGAVGDPVLNELNRTRCAGATGGAGTKGRTRIRIAMTSWHGDRGIAIAERLRQMFDRGCNVKVVYAVMGNEILRIMRRGGPRPIPLRQIVQDFDSDGVYDRYLHIKTMTISGNYDGVGDAEVTFNGSANWTPVALVSDEAGMRIFGRGVRAQYEQWVDRLYANPPYNPGGAGGSAGGAGRTVAGRTTVTSPAHAGLAPAEVEQLARARGVDPYREVQVN
ncbi:phospholipase D-like domain-containing protein [Nocardioides perillae]|uniref:phospholipase D n=1 Tax=Nocardioides perillae TaxID=1119534 RepID=A0A7Y9RV83_9ACTN|nr:phosphatidylserine/phosphatidylglycerophosphate/cardiolipin synthase-like enzyme [Nocardioides perillae]